MLWRRATYHPGTRPGLLLVSILGMGLACSSASTDTSFEEPVSTQSQAMHSSHSGSPPWPHVLTCYGGCEAPHYDPSACNHHTSCGPIADGNWWYATERIAFHCGAKLKLERGDKCVVVDVQDNGPADWVEGNAASECGTPYIIDTSPLVHDYFGGGCGWGECFIVQVSPVADDTPTGPEGCNTCDCEPGQQQSQGCGSCGTQTRQCAGDCHWGGWSSCTGQGECSAGAEQSQDCCDCGSKKRTCSASCKWGDWSGCSGPDPDQGTQHCDTGEPGPCADGRRRCVEGCLTCKREYEPQPEVCDDIDNDCKGGVDDGYPKTIADAPPDFAARLIDASAPTSLVPGQSAHVWAMFRNVGSKPWPKGKIWFVSESSFAGSASPLYDAKTWSSWDTSAVVASEIAPGSDAIVQFDVHIASSAEARVSDTFVLLRPDAQPIHCPSPSLTVSLFVDRSAQPNEVQSNPPSDSSGCGCRLPSQPPSQPVGWIALAIVLIAVRRTPQKRRPTTEEKPQ